MLASLAPERQRNEPAASPAGFGAQEPRRSIGNQARLRRLEQRPVPADGIAPDGSGADITNQLTPDAGASPPPTAPVAGVPAGTTAPAPASSPAPAGPPPVVTIDTVNAATTPAGAISRIPPRVDTSVAVTITGSGSVDLSIQGANATNGDATIDGAPSATLTESGSVSLSGTVQTAPGSAGKLKLVAKSGAATLAASNAFTVCAIPTTISIALDSSVMSTRRGIVVTTTNDSDSADVSDLDQVQMSEKVEFRNAVGCFKGMTGAITSGFLPANNTPHALDAHTVSASLLTGPGSQDVHQLFVFNDGRSGTRSAPVKNSGFNIRQEVTITPATPAQASTTPAAPAAPAPSAADDSAPAAPAPAAPAPEAPLPEGPATESGPGAPAGPGLTITTSKLGLPQTIGGVSVGPGVGAESVAQPV